MIEKIITFSAHNKALVFVLTIMITIAGWLSMKQIPIDAIPDLSETQVIIYSEWDRSPDILEDQVTYPIISALLGAPKVKTIRGFSDFGFSYIYVIFEDHTDIYWARSRVLEYLSKITPSLPSGVKTELGPDATGVGWVFQYAIVDKTQKQSLAELRSYQDWFLRFVLQGVPGVAEVASIGGHKKQYQIKLKPNILKNHNLSITDIATAVKASNNEVGARLLEISGAEYMIRGKGYLKSISDIENIVIAETNGTPLLLKHISEISIGPDIRRGVSDLDGTGDAVGGIVIMRYGENAPAVISKIKQKLEEVKKNLPDGVEIITTYDRSDLIERAIATLKSELILEMFVVSLVILIFLLHFPSAMIPIITLPLAVLISFIPMHFFGVSANIMSLGGIAIAIGAMVDAAIIVVENCHKHLEEWELTGRREKQTDVILKAIIEVGPASFYSLLVIAVAFLPIFALEGQEGKLFKPLAYTKNLSMIVAAILSITFDPALRIALSHFELASFKPTWLANIRNILLVGKNVSEDHHPISRVLFKIYGPVVDWAIDHRKKVIIVTIISFLSTIPIFYHLGSEFMPPLNEGTILYMPTTMPGISVTTATELLQKQDQIIKSFPEVERVFGKAGRATTSTDPAPFSMMETTIILKPEHQWRHIDRWYSNLPTILQYPFKLITPDRLTYSELIQKLDQALQIPGNSNAWTMPIRARIDMLSTGIRTPVGIKVLGTDLEQVEQTAIKLEKIIPQVEGARSVFAERISGGYFLDFDFNRKQMARYGISIEMAQMTLMNAIGGDSVTTTIEGKERYSVNIRYHQDYRSNIESLKKVLVKTMSGVLIPLGEIAEISLKSGPSMIRNELGFLTSYVYIDVADRDIGSFVKDAKKVVSSSITIPSNINIEWSGQFENMERVKERLKTIVPITLFLIIILIFINTKSWIKTSIVLLAVPFSAIGAVWLLWILDYNMSIAVWVGLIALLGVDAETGIFMLLYLDLSYEKAKKNGHLSTFDDLKRAIHEGAVKRIRPKIMTVGTLFIALLPIMLTSSTQAGADVMKRIAAPMFGGVTTSFLLELLVYPAIYAIWKWRELNQLKR